MCRHLAYVGPDTRVAGPLLDAPHDLAHQSYAARELLTGTVAADGFGAAWYRDEVGPTPAVYRTTKPIWSDRTFASVATHALGHTIVANVRNATETGTTDEANVHPFDHERFVFSHNGYLEDFRPRFMRALRSELSDVHYAALRGASDAETIFRLVLTKVDGGASLRSALADVVEALVRAADERGAVAQLNLIATDGATVVATRASNQKASNSLYTITDGTRFPGASLVASEPLDDDAGWQAVPDRHIVVLHAGEPVQLVSLA